MPGRLHRRECDVVKDRLPRLIWQMGFAPPVRWGLVSADPGWSRPDRFGFTGGRRDGFGSRARTRSITSGRTQADREAG
jgi:hypothetical protein